MIIRRAAEKNTRSRVFKGDKLYFMEKGLKKISAKTTIIYVKLSEEITKTIADNNKLRPTDKQRERRHKKCLCLTEIDNIESIAPLNLIINGIWTGRLIIEKTEDVAT